MKKILFSLALCATVLVGCDQKRLEIPQKGVIPTSSFYITDEDAQSALIAAYSYSGQWYANNNDCGWNNSPFLASWIYPGDDVLLSGMNKADNITENELNSLRYDVNNGFISGAYKSYYRSIYSCNLVICNFDDSTPVKAKARAEARILRAFAHLQLAIGWGAVPIVDEILDGAAKPGNSESREAVFQWIAKECSEALPLLDEKPSVDDKPSAVKVTKAFALATEGKARLFLKDYSGAAKVLKQIIDSHKYALVPSDQMETLFHVSGDGCSENIFEFNLVFDPSVSGYGNKALRNQYILWNYRSEKIYLPTGEGSPVINNGWGEMNPTKKFVDALLANDGYDSARRKAWIKSYDEMMYEMPYATDSDFPTLAEKKKDPKRGAHTSDGIYGNCGWYHWKRNWRQEDRSQYNGNMQNLPLMRYPEVLLMYAECQAMTGDSDGSGLAALNLIQERAQANHRSTECSLSEVKNEKFLELYMEGVRFQDLVRWGDTKELEANGTYYPNWCDAFFTKNEPEHRGYIDDSDSDWCKKLYDVGFKKGKHELFPYPYSEISINENLVQNPGW